MESCFISMERLTSNTTQNQYLILIDRQSYPISRYSLSFNAVPSTDRLLIRFRSEMMGFIIIVSARELTNSV